MKCIALIASMTDGQTETHLSGAPLSVCLVAKDMPKEFRPKMVYTPFPGTKKWDKETEEKFRKFDGQSA